MLGLCAVRGALHWKSSAPYGRRTRPRKDEHRTRPDGGWHAQATNGATCFGSDRAAGRVANTPSSLSTNVMFPATRERLMHAGDRRPGDARRLWMFGIIPDFGRFSVLSKPRPFRPLWALANKVLRKALDSPSVWGNRNTLGV